MSYCTLDDLRNIVPDNEMITITGGAGVIDRGRAATAILSASTKVNTYLHPRYSVPLEPVPEMIRDICADIAIYNLYSIRYKNDLPNNIRNRYEDAMKILGQIAGGSVQLRVQEEPVIVTAGAFQVSKRSRIFGTDLLDRL